MHIPIGGPRFWRRLVSRWWNPTDRMQREWEQRAQADAFGYIGRGYAESDTLFWQSGRTDMERLVLDGIELAPGASALEIGCGVGRLLRPLAGRIATVHGVDIAPGMVTRGRQLLADVPNAHLHVTDGAFTMLPTASLDFVFSFVVFQHIPSKPAIIRYIRESARVLKPGGVFKFQVDGRARSAWRGADTWLGAWFRPGEIRAILAGCGFEVVDSWGEATQYYWLTARLSAPAPTAPVVYARAVHPTWRRAGLERLLARLHVTAPNAVNEITTGRRPLREFGRPFLKTQRQHGAAAFVQAAFHSILGRTADESGLRFYTSQLTRGASRAYIIDCLLSSAELREQVRDSAVTAP
jgi:SAM-dependent methyltransferase